MKKILSVSVLVGISLMTVGLSYAQLKIPKENIPSDIPANVRKQIERLYSSDPVERAYGAYYLGKMGERAVSAIPFLVEILDDDNADVLINTLGALGNIKDPRAIDPLIKILVSKEMDLQPWAMAALKEIGEPAVEPLITILKDKDEVIQSWARYALTVIGEPAVERLIVDLKDKDENVRFNAVFVLGEINNNRAVEPLIETLKDENMVIRRCVVVSLGKIEDPRAVEPLIIALKDKDTLVQRLVARVLKKITGKDFGQDPIKWQEWWEKNKGKFGKGK